MSRGIEAPPEAGCTELCEFCELLPCAGRPAHDVAHLCANTAVEPCPLVPEARP